MENSFNSHTRYAPLILRVGLAFVFLWFGFNQIINQEMWVSLIPSGIVSLTGISAKTLVLCNGLFEVIGAGLLAFGIRIRLVASILLVHMVGIVGSLGFTAVAVRDVGLMFGLLSAAFYGADQYSIDKQVQ